MKVFKFGGASVKDSSGVKNLKKILLLFGNEPITVVISAMGKTTNSMEKILDAWLQHSDELPILLNQLTQYHLDIIHELNIPQSDISDHIDPLLEQLKAILTEKPSEHYDYEYDRIVPFGEDLSTTIVSLFLNREGIHNRLLNAAHLIRTDNRFREGQVDWETTENLILEAYQTYSEPLKITQGFIGGTFEKSTTTLGREGSDYSAAIFAYVLNAEEVTIWKDVPGLLNADPKRFDNVVKIDQLPYEEAIELAYYGATVIHPKTIKPLQNKQIPLYVKPFLSPEEPGTLIADVIPEKYVPCYIVKEDQVLISFYPKDFSFIAVNHLSGIFQTLSQYHVKINLMQNSALSFSICINNQKSKTRKMIRTLSKKYRIKYNEKVELITLRHYEENTFDEVFGKRKIFVEQKDRTTFQVVVRSK